MDPLVPTLIFCFQIWCVCWKYRAPDLLKLTHSYLLLFQWDHWRCQANWSKKSHFAYSKPSQCKSNYPSSSYTLNSSNSTIYCLLSRPTVLFPSGYQSRCTTIVCWAAKSSLLFMEYGVHLCIDTWWVSLYPLLQKKKKKTFYILLLLIHRCISIRI